MRHVFVISAKGADARRQTAKELHKTWGGVPDPVPVFLISLLFLSLTFLFSQTTWAEDAAPPQPHLLLSVKLLRRLKRDRDRQTVRWTAFENRVKTVPDSPERGFELALYYAITTDEARGKEAVAWAAAHPCERRQDALIEDWVGGVTAAVCATPPSLRDQAFQLIAKGADVSALAQKAKAQLIPQLSANGIGSASDLYATIELLSVLRANGAGDIREGASQFFRSLPEEFLLSMKPEQVEKPDWMMHVAALALVTVDPNLEASQFLQGWAMEERQTLHTGSGVAYELLWADPYLPGIAYQNLDPWFYDDERGQLYARSGWDVGACWVSVSRRGVQELNCPPGWQDKTVQFGSLTLLPMDSKCLEVARQDTRQSFVVWKLAPGETVTYRDKKEIAVYADVSGMWRPGANIEGKVCRR